ncbi:uncharacterized protein B0T23DRAFT_428194 [Neurospora hispaniola]|uniref:Uncharacterized protein n=1 Tax=Neurospora hispaniola TaxID=588809 RepID=A0AAJ0IB16_9PEZI|nr:hypothetical protein B0T23DRAFT_428194 [Neurospora hispaniola]
MRAIEKAETSSLPLHAVAVRRGDLALLGTTDEKKLNEVILTESICATLFIALHRCTIRPKHQGTPRFPRRTEENGVVLYSGYYTDNWVRIFQTFAYFNTRRYGNIALGSTRATATEEDIPGPYVFSTNEETSLARQEGELPHNAQSKFQPY